MQIDISEIVSCENREVTEKVHIEQDTFVSRLGEFPITKSAPFDLRIANREGSELLLSGETDLTVSIPCSRCLTEVPTDIHIVIDKKLRMDGTEVVDDEMEETDYLIGLNLDIDKLIYGEILVNWPMKVLCREDCKGICKVCGMNLNKGNCDCQRTELDPRMAAIQDVFKRRANWKMTAPALVKCSKCGELMMPHRVCKNCGSYNKKEIIPQD